jgi:uncharacterized membrane protein
MEPTEQESLTGNTAPSALLAQNVTAVAQLEAAERARLSASERFSDAVARAAGTGWFAALHVAWFAGWIAWNTALVPGWRPVDPFPFAFLTLIVSLEAIFLSIFVLISQNNLTRQSERRAQLDLQINLLAEQESSKTVALLERIAQQLHVPVPEDPCDSELASPTDIRDVVSTLESVQPADRQRVSKAAKGVSGNDPTPKFERPRPR